MSVIITNVMAVSLDGRIGKSSLESDNQRREYNFTNLDDQDFVRDQLEQADAVITGANSLRASGGAWQVKNDKGRNPSWIVLTNSGLDQSLRFWQQQDVHRAIVSPDAVQQELCTKAHVENWIYGKESPVSMIIGRLESLGYHRVLLFGGGSVNQMFYERGLVDFAKITLCPIIIGAVSAPFFVNPGLTTEIKFELISSTVKRNLVFLSYKVQK